MTYNPSIGSPNRRPVSTYCGEDSRDLPKNYAQAREAFERADKRRGGARGKVAHNTTIHERTECCARPASMLSGDVLGCAVHGIRGIVYAVRLHNTDIVTFREMDIELHSGGYQTFTTRDRWNRCGIRVGMGGGVPVVYHGAKSYPYVDGMRLKFRSDGTPGMVWYPNTAQPVGSIDAIRSRRRRVLARAQRLLKLGDNSQTDPFYWPGRAGGETPYRGTVPEVFRTDSECGLKPLNRKKIAAQVAAISGVKQD